MSETNKEKTPVILKTHLASSWYMFLGMILGPAIIYFERDPQGGNGKWIVLSLLFVGLFLHRLGLKYILTEKEIVARSWWGLGREDRLQWKNLAQVQVNQGFSGRLAGCGHIWLSSLNPDERSINMLGQKDPERVAEAIKSLAARAASGSDHGPA